MSRVLLIATAAVCVAAGVAVGIVVYVNSQQAEPAAPPVVAEPAAVVQEDELPPFERPPVPFTPKADLARVLVKTDGKPLTPEQADEQRLKMRKLHMRRGRRRKENRKYALAVSPIVTRMVTAKDPAIRLTAEQADDVGQITEEMKPRTDEVLKEIWSEREALRKELHAIYEQGRSEHMEPARQRYSELAEQEKALREELNVEYCARLKSVLTEEQLPFLEGNLSPEQMQRLFGYAPQNVSRSYTFGSGDQRVEVHVPIETRPDTP
jgi:hypothetical protein